MHAHIAALLCVVSYSMSAEREHFREGRWLKEPSLHQSGVLDGVLLLLRGAILAGQEPG